MPSQLPWTQRVIAFFGGFWEMYPWLAIGYGLLLSVLSFLGAPNILLLLMQLFGGGLGLGLIFWMVVDVIDCQASILWLIGFLLCSPVGIFILIAYMLWGRT